MIYMSHPVHGAMNCYLDSEVEANKKNGWVIGEVQKVSEVEKVPEVQKVTESPADAYEKKFGKPPHHRLSTASIMKALLEE